MKKRLFLLILLVLLSLTLYACNNSNDEKIKIKIGFWPDPSQTSDVNMYKTWEEAFEKDYPQYDIVADPYTYSPETVAAKGYSGKLPTIFQTYFTEPESLITQGFIREITPQLEALGWLDKMDDSMRATLTKDGKVYGVPRDGYGMGLFINLEMMYDIGVIEKNSNGNYMLYDEENNPLYPTTFDQVTELSRIVVETYEDKYGLLILSSNKQGGWQLANFAWNFGTSQLQTKDANGKWVSNLADEGMVRALEWIKQLNDEGLIVPGAALNYNDWSAKIGSGDVMMAFVGSDALAQPITSYGFKKDNFAFVPMPTGDGINRFALFGGTPYVFAENATSEQVEGALRFLKYIGRSPETDQISYDAMELGFSVAESKGMPILPTIKAWKDPSYLEMANNLENSHINVNYDYMKDFFDSIHTMRHAEEPNYCQEMYDQLDDAIQAILDVRSTTTPLAALTTANNQFQKNYLDKLNK